MNEQALIRSYISVLDYSSKPLTARFATWIHNHDLSDDIGITTEDIDAVQSFVINFPSND